jgi:hypothetical protein
MNCSGQVLYPRDTDSNRLHTGTEKITTELQALEVTCFIVHCNRNVKKCVGSRSPQNI